MFQLKEAACCGIGCISRLSSELAMTAVSQGAVKLLVNDLQLNEARLKYVAALALGDIARHSASHAKVICQAGGLLHLSKCIDHLDTKLKVRYNILRCLVTYTNLYMPAEANNGRF